MKRVALTLLGMLSLGSSMRDVAAESTSGGSPAPADQGGGGKDQLVATTVADLVAHPDRFAGKHVRVSGYWITAFEYSGLHSTPKSNERSHIWVECWSIPGQGRQVRDPQAIQDALAATYSKAGVTENAPVIISVTLEGYFEHKSSIAVTKESYPFTSGYGHLGQYESRLTIARVVEANVLATNPSSL